MYSDKPTVMQEVFSRGHFTQIPNELFRATVSQTAKILWCYLHSQSVRFNPRYDQICHDLGIRRQSIKSYLDELTSTNMINVKKGDNNSNVYMINAPSRWSCASKEPYFGRCESAPTPQESSTENAPTGSTGIAPKVRCESAPKVRCESAPTNNTKNNTKNNNTAGKCSESNSRIINLTTMLVDVLKSKRIAFDKEQLTRTLGLINHQLSWSERDIEIVMPELDLYLMGSNPRFHTSIYHEVYKWFANYKKPLSQNRKVGNKLPQRKDLKMTEEEIRELERKYPNATFR